MGDEHGEGGVSCFVSCWFCYLSIFPRNLIQNCKGAHLNNSNIKPRDWGRGEEGGGRSKRRAGGEGAGDDRGERRASTQFGNKMEDSEI